jgi:hypothetical protein
MQAYCSAVRAMLAEHERTDRRTRDNELKATQADAEKRAQQIRDRFWKG